VSDREQKASDWFARMRGPDADRHRAAFEAWRGDPANAAAYADAEGDWLAMNGLAPEHRVVRGPATSAPRPSFAGWAVAASLLLTVAAGAAWYLRADPSVIQVAERPVTSVPVAADRTVRLADGSEVVLMGGARLEERFKADTREVVLIGGRARFIVAHDAGRPFVVFARGSRTTALGTVFEVDLRGSHPLVNLLSGSVEVSGERGKKTVRLVPGESAEVEGQDARRVAAQVTAAGTTILQAERLPLGEVIERANRVGGAPIRLANPELRARRVSGRFDISDSESLARKLAAALDLHLASEAGGHVLSAKDKKAGE
jgi:transmembrane sensor